MNLSMILNVLFGLSLLSAFMSFPGLPSIGCQFPQFFIKTFDLSKNINATLKTIVLLQTTKTCLYLASMCIIVQYISTKYSFTFFLIPFLNFIYPAKLVSSLAGV